MRGAGLVRAGSGDRVMCRVVRLRGVARGFGRLPRECASVLETRPKGAPGRDKPVPYDLVPGIGTGKGVTLLPELSVILATPSFSTSSMRITACMGMKLR